MPEPTPKPDPFVLRMLGPLLENVAAPIRGFYLGVGDPIVASTALVCLTALALFWGDLEALTEPAEPSQPPAAVEPVSEPLAELFAPEAPEEVPMPEEAVSWSLEGVRLDLDGGVVHASVSPTEGAEALVMAWKALGGTESGHADAPLVGGEAAFPFPPWGSGAYELSWAVQTAGGDLVAVEGSPSRVEVP